MPSPNEILNYGLKHFKERPDEAILSATVGGLTAIHKKKNSNGLSFNPGEAVKNTAFDLAAAPVFRAVYDKVKPLAKVASTKELQLLLKGKNAKKRIDPFKELMSKKAFTNPMNEVKAELASKAKSVMTPNTKLIGQITMKPKGVQNLTKVAVNLEGVANIGKKFIKKEGKGLKLLHGFALEELLGLGLKKAKIEELVGNGTIKLYDKATKGKVLKAGARDKAIERGKTVGKYTPSAITGGVIGSAEGIERDKDNNITFNKKDALKGAAKGAVVGVALDAGLNKITGFAENKMKQKAQENLKRLN